MRSAALAVSAILFASPAFAQFEVWLALGEEALHSRTFAHYDGKPGALFAPCDPSGKLSLPMKYAKDYQIPPSEKTKLERPLQALRRFATPDEALKAGYLPNSRGFIQSVGLAMIHPELLQDGKVDVERPDILTYVRKKGLPQYRLVSAIYAGGATKPQAFANLKRVKKEEDGGPDTLDGWDFEEDVCIVVRPRESVGFFIGQGQAPSKCKGGVRFPRLWLLHHWGLVYNPQGIFFDENPMVDYIDQSQLFGPLCPKGKLR